MRTIDKNFPIFAQIESGDEVFTFHAMRDNPLQSIQKIRVKWYDYNALMDYNYTQEGNFHEYIDKDLMCEPYSISQTTGKGFATSFEAAKKAIIEMLEKQISIEQKEIDSLNRQISIAQSDIEKYRKAIESLS